MSDEGTQSPPKDETKMSNQPQPLTEKELAHRQQEAYGYMIKPEEMTNRERAEKIVHDIVVPVTSTPETEYEKSLCKMWVGPIERALDEAEKRGQEKMRERAAKEADKCCVVGDECGGKVPWCRACLSAMNIRALPIEE